MIATNSEGFTNIGASPRSILIVGSCVSTAAADATVLDPSGNILRAFPFAASVVANDTAVCQNAIAHISLYPPPVNAVCTKVSILTPRIDRRLPE